MSRVSKLYNVKQWGFVSVCEKANIYTGKVHVGSLYFTLNKELNVCNSQMRAHWQIQLGSYFRVV